MSAPFKRGDRVFICQKGLPEFGQYGRVLRTDRHLGAGWYIVAEGNAKRATGCVHESWLNREKPESGGLAKALGYIA